MPTFDVTKLKDIKENINNYLAKHDIDYKKEKGFEKIIDQLVKQNETLASKFGSSIASLDRKVDLAMAEKVIASVPQSLVKELQRLVDAIPNKTIVVDPGTKEITANLKELGKEISHFSAKIASQDSKQAAELKRQMAMLQDSIESLVAKEVVIPKPPSVIQVEGINKLDKKLDDLAAIFRTLSRSLTKEPKVKDRTDEIIKAIKDIKLEAKDIEFPSEIFVNPGSSWPPQKVANPVTHININSLKGNVHQTTTTVTTTLTPLPSYGVLDDRRAIIFYNNSSSITVYIGGSTVTASTGTPIEPKSFSPSFDSGPLQKWYGITSSGTADVRCLELPDEEAGR